MSTPERGSSYIHPAFEPSPMQRAMALRREINLQADRHVTHPFIVIKELRQARADNALKALEIQERYTTRYGYVGDLHGLDDETFAKLRKTLLTEGFDHIFFIGDIGGSASLARLQRLFYQGSDSPKDNKLWNRYQQLKKADVDEKTILHELKEGYLNLHAYELVLENHGRLSDQEAREQAERLADEEILQKILWAVKHKHYGHYVSDLSDQIITTLASDVESYYERFARMVAEIRLTTKAKVHVIRGNWDPRLPFDFEKGTEDPVPLVEQRRRFQDRKYFQEKGIEYYATVGFVETTDALHVLVPFDAVAKWIGEEGSLITPERLETYRRQVEEARLVNRTVIMVAHAVPAYRMHRKPSTIEGQVTEGNLRRLIGKLQPDEIVYGHEHFVRQDESGNYLHLDTKYRLYVLGEENVKDSGQDEQLADLDQKTEGVIATYVPISTENFSGVASLEVPKKVKNNRNRSNRRFDPFIVRPSCGFACH